MDSIPAFDPRVDGAICRFNLSFVEDIGENSLFLKTLSDLWTIALLRLWKAHGLCDLGDLPVVFSTPEAVEVLRELCAKDENLKRALFQEPFGFGERGDIERAFTQAFGDGVYARWRDAFEGEQFSRCHAMMEGAG